MTEKGLDLWEAVSIGIGGMIGGGIFAVLGLAIEVAKFDTPLAFAFAGFVALITAYSYAKLSVRYPSSGGTVEFLGLAFQNGLLVGVLNVLLLLSYVIMLSLYAYAFGSYGAALLGGGEILRHVLISGVLILFALLNLMGSEVVGRSEEAIVLIKVSILLLFILASIGIVNWASFALSSPPQISSVVAGGMIIFLAYEGFELIANASPEVKNPQKNIPLAFFISVAAVTAIYVLISIGVLGTTPYSVIIKARDYALAVAAKPILGRVGFVLIAIAALLSTASAINATIYGSARVAFMLAAEGELPGPSGKFWNKPAEGILLVTLMALLVANLVDLAGISTTGSAGFLLVFAFVNLAALKLRSEIKANPIITGLAALLCLGSFVTLLVHQYFTHLGSVAFFLVLLTSAVVIEAVSRLTSKRKLKLRFWKEYHGK